MTAAAPDDGNRSLQRGLTVLEAIWTRRHVGARLVDLTRACGLERPTVYRLLSTLLAGGYVTRRDRYWYQPGPRLEIFGTVSSADDLAQRLQPVLQQVSDATGDATFAVVREGAMSHCIARCLGTYPTQVLTVDVGRRQPLGVGAAGLALLSALSDREITAIVAANAQTLGNYGGMTPERLTLLIKATRERGWSLVGNHVVADALGVGCVVLSAGGVPVAGISVAAPMHRMTRQRQAVIVKTMRQAVSELNAPDA